LQLGLGRFFKKVSELSEEEKEEFKSKTPDKPALLKPVPEEESKEIKIVMKKPKEHE
jgi:hypothetical protein